MASEQQIGFVEGDFNEQLFSELLRNVCKSARYVKHEEIPLSGASGYVSDLSKQRNDCTKRVVGFRAFRLKYENADSIEKSVNVVFKIKVKGSQSWNAFADMLIQKGYDKLGNMTRNSPFDSTLGSELKEIACYNVRHPTWDAIRPAIFTTLKNIEKDIYVVAMEEISVDSFTHMNTTNDVSPWTSDDIQDVFQGIAAFHALYFGKTEGVPFDVKVPIDATNAANPYSDPNVRSLLKCAVEHNLEKHSDILGTIGSKILQKSLDNMSEVCAVLSNFPVTLVHNDFSIRNVCLRKAPKANESRLCVYDWEVVRITVPQHDIAEFIAFVLPEDSPLAAWDKYLEVYRESLLKELEQLCASKETLETVQNKDKFKSVFHMSIIEFLWNRLAAYIFLREMLPMPFVHRVVKNVVRYVEEFSKDYPFLNVAS